MCQKWICFLSLISIAKIKYPQCFYYLLLTFVIYIHFGNGYVVVAYFDATYFGFETDLFAIRNFFLLKIYVRNGCIISC